MDVSVIVPCYNTERFLDQALASAEQNTRCELEVIVLDDGSCDGSRAIMDAHAARDERVRVIAKDNQGYGATVNRGLDEAQGIYVAILEPDDWVLPHMYDDLYELARYMGGPDVVKTPYWRVMGACTSRERRAYGYLHGRIAHVRERICLQDEPQLIQYHPCVWSALYRREFLRERGIRMREVPGAGWVDNPFSVHALAAARSITYVDDAYYCYREDLPGASSATVSPQLMIDRWNDRQDALDALGVRDEGVLRANCIAGLRFLDRIWANDDEDEVPGEAVGAMVGRMDPALVASVDCISPKTVKRCLALQGSVLHAPSPSRYARHLAQEAAWALANNGPAFCLHNLMLARERSTKQ